MAIQFIISHLWKDANAFLNTHALLSAALSSQEQINTLRACALVMSKRVDEIRPARKRMQRIDTTTFGRGDDDSSLCKPQPAN